MSKHSSPSTVGWGQRALLALLALVVLAAGVGAWRLLTDGGAGVEQARPTASGAGGD